MEGKIREAESAESNRDKQTYPEDESKPLTVKDMGSDEQPREKALRHGFRSLTNAECLAIILRVGRPGRPITEICKDLMSVNDNKFLMLERMADEELMEINGIGQVKVLEIRAMMEIMRRYAEEKIGDRVQFKSSESIYEYMRYKIGNLRHEEMWAIFVDNSNKKIGEMKVTEGSSKATVYDPKKILRTALLRGAEGVILCHNHPSGALRPSGPDTNITRALAESCRLMELKLIDHLIVTTDGYYSFFDNGMM